MEEGITNTQIYSIQKKRRIWLWVLIGIFLIFFIVILIYNLFNSSPPIQKNSPLQVSSDLLVLSNPPLINIPYNSEVRLKFIDGEGNIKNSSQMQFTIFHPVPKVKNPESIIFIDSEGYAHYNSEGYIIISAILRENGERYSSEEIILAGGEVYGNPLQDRVIAVFPSQFKPEGSNYSFVDMMDNYPNFMKLVNLAYNIESELYEGFKPYNGETQILALLEIPDHCGGNNNPLETASHCYMNIYSGEPQYDVIVHEMGHNFADGSQGMNQLLSANNATINRAGFGECVASLPVQYLRAKILENPRKYGFTKDDYEYKTWAKFQELDNNWNKERLERFENYISQGKTIGILDIDSMEQEEIDSLQGNVGAFCSFFVTVAAYPEDFENKYAWDFYKRFLSLFGDQKLQNFKEEDVETYFAAAFSAAAGSDLRDKLRLWGFKIEKNYYNELYQEFSEKLK